MKKSKFRLFPMEEQLLLSLVLTIIVGLFLFLGNAKAQESQWGEPTRASIERHNIKLQKPKMCVVSLQNDTLRYNYTNDYTGSLITDRRIYADSNGVVINNILFATQINTRQCKGEASIDEVIPVYMVLDRTHLNPNLAPEMSFGWAVPVPGVGHLICPTTRSRITEYYETEQLPSYTVFKWHAWKSQLRRLAKDRVDISVATGSK